jgi:hypothetical protein
MAAQHARRGAMAQQSNPARGTALLRSRVMRMFVEAARAAVVVGCLLWHAEACGQSAADLIRAHVEELRVGGHLELLGQPVASREVLPRVYENREFEPAWSTLRQIDGLLEIIDEATSKGSIRPITAASRTSAERRRISPRSRRALAPSSTSC